MPMFHEALNFNRIRHIANKSRVTNGCGKIFLHSFFSSLELATHANFVILTSITSYTSDYNGMELNAPNGIAEDYISAVHGKTQYI